MSCWRHSVGQTETFVLEVRTACKYSSFSCTHPTSTHCHCFHRFLTATLDSFIQASATKPITMDTELCVYHHDFQGKAAYLVTDKQLSEKDTARYYWFDFHPSMQEQLERQLGLSNLTIHERTHLILKMSIKLGVTSSIAMHLIVWYLLCCPLQSPVYSPRTWWETQKLSRRWFDYHQNNHHVDFILIL